MKLKIKKLLALAVTMIAPGMLFANSTTDRQIEDAANGSYNFRAVLNQNVKARSEDGVVTLTGTVQAPDQRSLAEDTVNNLPGVVAVVDKIDVESAPPERSDAWIAMKIHGELLVHANVSATATKVDVNNGVVLLTGTVDNAAQRDLTEAYVRDVSGVQSVTNELVVKDPPMDSPSIGETIDDASITSEIKITLLSHGSTSAVRTKVTTKDGVVMITGDASSDAEKDLVTKLTSGIRGVRAVDNEMVVKPTS